MIKRVSIYWRNDNPKAVFWAGKLKRWMRSNFPKVAAESSKPQAVIVLGGDGTILAAAQKYQNQRPLIIGLNLGHVGFLASVREPKKFLPALKKFLKGEYKTAKRMMIKGEVWRGNRKIFSANALNDISIQNLLGMAEIEADVDGHPVQYIRGSGGLVATATGSTAYNLSPPGPIVMPDIKCMILTEIMDHNIPTPSIVIKRDREISFKILDFRRRGLIKLAKTGEEADVVITADGDKICSLKKGDIIKIRRSPGLVKFAELERAYFFKSLSEKFAFR